MTNIQANWAIKRIRQHTYIADPKAELIYFGINAHMDVSKQLVFSEELVEHFRDSLYQKWTKENEKSLRFQKRMAFRPL
jgi:hypothetical protein